MAKEKVRKVVAKERTTVYATGKSSFLKEGKVIKTHPIAAEKLINLGFATEKKTKADQE